MVIAAAEYTLSVPGSRSLKDKRQALRGLLDRLRNGLKVSAAEVGSQELWNRAEIGVVAACSNHATAQAALQAVDDVVNDCLAAEVLERCCEARDWPSD